MPGRCHSSGCTVSPCFNHVGLSIGTYCVTHKLPGMIDVRNRSCCAIGCRIRASFNHLSTLGTKVYPTYCRIHKQPGMVNVVSKRCAEPGCNSVSPKYYCPTASVHARYCTKHRTPTMMRYTRTMPRVMEPNYPGSPDELQHDDELLEWDYLVSLWD